MVANFVGGYEGPAAAMAQLRADLLEEAETVMLTVGHYLR